MYAKNNSLGCVYPMYGMLYFSAAIFTHKDRMIFMALKNELA